MLGLTLAAALAVVGLWWRRRAPPTLDTGDARRANLNAWIDTLMPPEPDFAGALALGVADTIVAGIDRDPAYAKLTGEALAWLDGQSRGAGRVSFSALDGEARERIVAAAAASAPGSAPLAFFSATRDDTLFHAYADPRAWVGLGYAGPPQPIGFMDHASAPKAT